MARLCAVANGNNTSASTWAVIDSTSYAESETSFITTPTSYATTYTQFTPGVVTTDGFALRLQNRTGTTGTFSAEIYNHTLGASVAGTEVTINCSDFVDALNASTDGGWYFFKFTSVTLIAANAYSVRFKTSNSSQINITSASSTTPNRFLRTTTTQAPVAGDDRFVMGEWTAAGTTTTRNVTGDDILNTDYGSASTSQVTPALSISAGGKYSVGTTASTTYLHKVSGNIVVYNGGEFDPGGVSTGSRMPTTSSATLTLDCVANIDFGIDVRRKGICKGYGEDKTRWTLLTADVAAGATVIPVVSTAGWKVGDVLVFAPTGTNVNLGETKTILTVDNSTQVTLTAGLTNAHTGTGDCVGEVGNLTSNVKIVGTSSTVGTYITFKESSLGVLDNVEVQYLGSATINKRGVECQHINTSSNSVTFNSSSFRDGIQSSMVGSVQSAGSLYYITNCVMGHSTGNNITALIATGGSTGTPTFDVSSNLLVMATTSNGTGMTMSLITGVGGTCTNNRIAGFSTGVSYSTSFVQDTVSDISGFKVHSCSTGISGGAVQTKNITSCDIVSNSTGLSTLTGITNVISCNILGNITVGLNIGNTGNNLGNLLTLNSCLFRGRTSFAQPFGIQLGNVSAQNATKIVCNLCTFGTTIAHTTSDIVANVYMANGQAIFNNCTFASTTEINSTAHTVLDENSIIGFQRRDTTAGDHYTIVRQGYITRETTTFRTASPSLKFTPKNATIPMSNKVKGFRVPVNSGQTCTPTAFVYEDASYNGNRAKLYVKANFNLGITADTLLATATSASDAAWEGLTGTTATVTDDGALEFYILCDGTAGNLFVDDFSAVNA